MGGRVSARRGRLSVLSMGHALHICHPESMVCPINYEGLTAMLIASRYDSTAIGESEIRGRIETRTTYGRHKHCLDCCISPIRKLFASQNCNETIDCER